MGLTGTGVASLAVYRCWVVTSIEELYSPVQHHRRSGEKERKSTHQQARHSSRSTGFVLKGSLGKLLLREKDGSINVNPTLFGNEPSKVGNSILDENLFGIRISRCYTREVYDNLSSVYSEQRARAMYKSTELTILIALPFKRARISFRLRRTDTLHGTTYETTLKLGMQLGKRWGRMTAR